MKAPTLEVEVENDHISITHKGKELVYWDEQEWKDDPEVVVSIANAIKMAFEDVNKLKTSLGK